MYQVAYENGYTLVVTRNGNRGRVDDSNSRVAFEGTLQQAKRWLADRNVSEAKIQNRAYPHA